MQRMYRQETDSHQRVQGRLDLSVEKIADDNLRAGKRFLPALVEQCQVGHVRSVDPELLDSENKLGCARGVIWVLIFEAAAITAIVVFWKLRFLLP